MSWRLRRTAASRGGPRAAGDGRQPGGAGGARRARTQGKRYFFRRRKVCKFCADKIDYIDYKDIKLLGLVRAGARQDPAAPHVRHLRGAPAQADAGDQAGAQHRAAALRGGVGGRRAELVALRAMSTMAGERERQSRRSRASGAAAARGQLRAARQHSRRGPRLGPAVLGLARGAAPAPARHGLALSPDPAAPARRALGGLALGSAGGGAPGRGLHSRPGRCPTLLVLGAAGPAHRRSHGARAAGCCGAAPGRSWCSRRDRAALLLASGPAWPRASCSRSSSSARRSSSRTCKASGCPPEHVDGPGPSS